MTHFYSMIMTVALAISIGAQAEQGDRLHIIVTNDLPHGEATLPDLSVFIDYSTRVMKGATTKVYLDAKDIPKEGSHKKIELYLRNNDASLAMTAIVVVAQWTRTNGKLCEVRRDLTIPKKSTHSPYYSDIKVNLSDFSESKCRS